MACLSRWNPTEHTVVVEIKHGNEMYANYFKELDTEGKYMEVYVMHSLFL